MTAWVVHLSVVHLSSVHLSSPKSYGFAGDLQKPYKKAEFETVLAEVLK